VSFFVSVREKKVERNDAKQDPDSLHTMKVVFMHHNVKSQKLPDSDKSLHKEERKKWWHKIPF
jgi:hypothetical protein